MVAKSAGARLAGLVMLATVLGLVAWGLATWQTGEPGPSGPGQAGPADLPGIFPRSAAFEYDPPLPGTYDLPVIKTAPDARLLNHLGQAVQLSSQLAGRMTLLSFVYLNCADAQGCPLAMATLWQIHDASAQRPQLRDAVQLVTISFDPARDTPEALNNIAATMAADKLAGRKIAWRLLTGFTASRMKPLLQKFGQAVNFPGGDPDAGQINHLLRMFLIDREGNVRNVYGLGSIDPRLIMTDVATLMLQDAGSH